MNVNGLLLFYTDVSWQMQSESVSYDPFTFTKGVGLSGAWALTEIFRHWKSRFRNSTMSEWCNPLREICCSCLFRTSTRHLGYKTRNIANQ